MVSIVFPDRLTIEAASLGNFPDVEVIGVEKRQAANRAERINIGISQAKGDLILLHHPRSKLDPAGIYFLVKNQKSLKWGGFTHTFDKTHPLLKYTSWYTNFVRPNISGILYLDHCIFFQRHLLTRKIPDVPIFEDTLLSYILRENGRPIVLPYLSYTSAIRYEKNGVFRQALLNQALKLGFYLGFSLEKLNAWYESRLNLN